MSPMTQNETMSAVVIDEFGGQDQLKQRDVPMPEMTADQVIVKEKAAGINPVDWKTREGYLQPMFKWPFPIILGWDVAGVITEVGTNVTDWKVGDRVFARPATTRFGTYAEFTAVDASLLAPKPENISFEEAAAVPLAGLTAWQALFDHGHLQKGEKVFIHAGSGGVGSFAIQLAKSVGAYVITTTSSTNIDFVKSLGADQVIDYHETDFTEVLKDIDLVVDTIGGEAQEKSVSILKHGSGRMVSITGSAAEKTASLAEDRNVSFESIWLDPNGAELTKLANMLENGTLKVTLDSVYKFSAEGVAEAHDRSESHHALGKIVVRFK
ncbi:NADPH:quinone reductase [Dellaglioa algida]|nr:NADPH:quinone reductase [Dellaglioa algida]